MNMHNDTLALRAAAQIGATPADLPGLWTAPGYPELTTSQMFDAARQKSQAGFDIENVVRSPVR